jgi:hypothetical protein
VESENSQMHIKVCSCEIVLLHWVLIYLANTTISPMQDF